MRATIFSAFLSLLFATSLASAQTTEVRTGADALKGWESDAPAVRRHIKISDLPTSPPSSEPETPGGSLIKIIKRPTDALPKVPDGFAVEVFASGFKQPRTIRVAPNGDVFLSESGAGRVLVFPASAPGVPKRPEVFAENLEKPYGIAFYPAVKPRIRVRGGGESGSSFPVSRRGSESRGSCTSDRGRHPHEATLDA